MIINDLFNNKQGIEEDLTRRGFLRGLGAAALAGASGGALAGSNDPNFVRKVHDQHNAMIEKNPRYAKEHGDLGIYIARGIVGASAENNKRWVEKTAKLLQKYGVKINEGIAENAGQPLSVQQLATISDEALDNAYGYGRSTPGNTFGWQANMKSAAYAKQIIDQGVTDIEAISDAIHKGWNTTAQAFVQNPDQFDDTAKLAAAGKLQAKLQQRAQLMKQNYAQLPEEEKEKDRVVARALVKAIKGDQSLSEGMAGQVVFSGTGANGSTYEIIQSSPTDFMIHANGRHIDTYGSLQRAMSVLKNEVPGLQQGVAEGVPQPGPSSGAPKQFGADAQIQTRQMTVKDIISSIPGVPYYNNVVDDWDAKDYNSWNTTEKVIEYATYLKDHPESLAKLPPIIVLNGKFEDGAHRLSAIWLLQQRMDPKNPLWKNAKLNVQFVKQGMAEGKADYNFDIEDLKRLEQIRDLATLKAQALELISKPSAKPMKPEKVEWFRNALERMNSPLKVIKLMYDLLLSGEGKAVVGTRSSMNPNTYRQRFGEQGVAENMADDMAAMAQKKFPTAYISKDGKEVQKPENWGKRYTPPAAAPADLEKQRRDLTAKYPNIDELVRRAELNRDPDYEMADGEAYYAARDAEQNYQKLRQIQRVIQGLNEHKERQNNMRTKEITESQLDEISLDQIGTGIANVIGGVSKAAGAVAGVPQGIGRAVKKGYRGAVKGIGGAADDGSNPRSDVPGAAYGDTSQGKELPTGTGEINPATGRAYVPSDFGNQADDIAADSGAENSPAAIQQQIRTVERNYQTQMADLTAKLKAVQGQGGASGPALSKQQQDYIASIGTDEPSAGSTAIAPTASTAPMAPDRSYEVNPTAPSMARDPKVLNTLQAMNAKELQIIKKILQARARATNESELSEVAFGDVWRGTGDRLKNATSGIRSAASGAASAVKGAAASAADMAKSAYKTAKPYVKKAGQFAAAVPGAVATGAGAVAGGVAGMKNAARKGYAAGQKHVGGGALTMDELQQAIGGMTADDAKQLLTFIKQLEIQNAPAKSKAKPKAKTSTTTPTTTTTTPTWTGRQKDLAAVAESLTWSRSFDPGMIVYKRMKSGR